MPDNNVHNLGGPRGTAGDGGGSGNGNGGFGERLVRLEETVKHLATSKDISEIKELIMKNDAEVKELIRKNDSEIKELIRSNDSEVRGLVHDNQIKIQQQQITNLKWGLSLIVPSVIAIAAIVFTALK